MLHSVIVIQYEDWQLWYVDGMLEFSDHSMEESQAFALGVRLGDTNISYVYVEDVFTGRERVYDVFGDGRTSPEKIDTAIDKMTDEEMRKFLEASEKYKEQPRRKE